eukprot:3074523-Amphidinium_carterae.4
MASSGVESQRSAHSSSSLLATGELLTRLADHVVQLTCDYSSVGTSSALAQPVCRAWIQPNSVTLVLRSRMCHTVACLTVGACSRTLASKGRACT